MEQRAENSIPAGSGFFHIPGLQRTGHALSASIFGTHGEFNPPGAVVVPEVVVGTVAGDTDVETKAIGVWCGHDDTFLGWFPCPNDRDTKGRSRRTARLMDRLRRMPALLSQRA